MSDDAAVRVAASETRILFYFLFCFRECIERSASLIDLCCSMVARVLTYIFCYIEFSW